MSGQGVHGETAEREGEHSVDCAGDRARSANNGVFDAMVPNRAAEEGMEHSTLGGVIYISNDYRCIIQYSYTLIMYTSNA